MQIVFDNIIPLPRTRFRRSDPATSKAAAEFAATGKAAEQRRNILRDLATNGPSTMREVAQRIGLSFVETSRRASEIVGIERTGQIRGGCAEWRASPGEPCYFYEEGGRAREALG